MALDGRSACCDATPVGEPRSYKQISQPSARRIRPSKGLQEQLLTEQGNRCLYCDRLFGSSYLFGTLQVVVRLSWDHLVPFAFRQDNGARNYAAACMRCNSWKSSRLFLTLQEARDFLAERWRRHLSYGFRRRDTSRFSVLLDVAEEVA